MGEKYHIGITNIMLTKGDAAITFKVGDEEGEIVVEAHIPGYEVGEVMSSPCVFADVMARLIRDQNKELMRVFSDYMAKMKDDSEKPKPQTD